MTAGMPTLADVSVIIPVAPGDESWIGLVPELRFLPLRTEILFVSPDMPGNAPSVLAKGLAGGRKVRWITAGRGRAIQLNAGAAQAKNPYLWFLHADSRIPDDALQALENSLLADPEALHYFELGFLADGPRWMRLNELGTWIRSRFLGIPFGDQAFCLSRSQFQRLGGFDENASYGEDHLLVWKARQAKVKLRSTGTKILTSARKYQDRGWWTTTRTHLALTAKQAWPEAVKLARARFGTRSSQ